MEEKKRVRALSLLSGGLDSRLAVCVLKEQGVEVQGVVFESPFFCSDAAKAAAVQLGIVLHLVDFTRDILSLLDKPKHGFGSCMNPCIDCHALMLRRAGEMLEEKGCHFLCTGEVLNERPMSQNRQAMTCVAKESGYEDLILRPLSAWLLSETLPEREGWVDRKRLLGIQGRGRKIQFDLAEKYQLKDYPNPAGGCRLTEPNFCKRLKDLKDHEGLDGVRSLTLLRYGRHFRLADNMKLIIGRDAHDNAFLEGAAELYDLVLKVEKIPGPTCLLPFTATREQISQAAAICARYSDCASDTEPVLVRVKSSRCVSYIESIPADKDEVERLRV